ncbi:hypothetical protein [Microbacterium oxydans]
MTSPIATVATASTARTIRRRELLTAASIVMQAPYPDGAGEGRAFPRL